MRKAERERERERERETDRQTDRERERETERERGRGREKGNRPRWFVDVGCSRDCMSRVEDQGETTLARALHTSLTTWTRSQIRWAGTTPGNTLVLFGRPTRNRLNWETLNKIKIQVLKCGR